jgi:hypothetical protein
MVTMHRLIGVGVLLVLLSGCEWLGLSSSTPTNSEKARPGAERGVAVTNSLPAARTGGYDGSVAPVDENRGAPALGSVVKGKGGQKAQKEEADKEAAERDAKAREERVRREREAALRKAQEKSPDGKDKTTPAVPPTTEGTPPAPAADATPAAPAAPAAPVSTAPLAPPPAAQPAPPADPKQ